MGHVLDSQKHLPEGYSIDDFYRVQFYTYEINDGIQTVKFHNTSYCGDFYADKTIDAILTEEIAGAKYVCPDIEQIDLLNMPTIYQGQNGSAFYLVVNSCEVAEKIDKAHNLTSYNDTYNCVPRDSDIWETYAN